MTEKDDQRGQSVEKRSSTANPPCNDLVSFAVMLVNEL